MSSGGHTDGRAPSLRISEQEFKALPEYSSSLPTGVTPGKRWKRLNGASDFQWRAAGGKPYWLIGEYQSIPNDEEHCRLMWYRPVVVCVSGRHHE